MGRRNRSISLPEDLSRAIDGAADAAGLTPSAWIAETARERLMIEDGLRAMDEFFAEVGEPADEDTAWAVDAVDRAIAYHHGDETAGAGPLHETAR